MRVPLSWLAEFVDLSPGTTPEEVHAALVRVGLEEEGVHGGDLQGPIVVGEVLSFVEEPQSNGKTIRWCQVQVAPAGEGAIDGGDAVRGIVCGASNFIVGDRVVVTLPGAVLPGPFPISARKTYGHVSDGMMASTRELGLGDDHAGIIRLVTLGLQDAPVGSSALPLLGLDDAAVEINVTPDRGYALSIRGVAREYSHATGATFRDPVAVADVTGPGGGCVGQTGTADAISDGAACVARFFPVTLTDDNPIRGRTGTSVFATRIVRGVDASCPTPPRMVSRLALAGIRSRSLLVDITNYVMLEIGQPIHGYDLDTLRGGITVRRARAGETLTTLDEKERALHPEDLIITDDRGPIGLAGVMGGADTELRDSTRNVLIEAAHFDPVSIARTARRHRVPSEASRRFERGVDPEIAEAATARVAHLIVKYAGGIAEPGTVVRGASGAEVVSVASGGNDLVAGVGSSAGVTRVIDLPADYIANRIGVDYSTGEIVGTLSQIGATVTETASGFRVTPPSWRPDLTGCAELAEEVARLTGYDRIPSVLPVAPPGRGLTRAQRLRRQAADALAAAGSVEVLTFPFATEAENAVFGVAAHAVTTFEAPLCARSGGVASIRLANPLDQTTGLLRRSLLPGLIAAARRNRARGLTDISLFEQGLVFLPAAGSEYGSATLPSGEHLPSSTELAALQAGIPPQPRHLAVLLTGRVIPRQPGQPTVAASIADALDEVRRVARAVGVTVEFVQGSHPAMHPGRTALIRVGDHTVGWVGELLPALAAELDLPDVVAVAELALDEIIAASSGGIVARAVGTFPAATQDLSLVVAMDVPAADVMAAVVAGAGELLEVIELVDDYRGSGVPIGTKSLTFGLRFRAPDRTLTAAEASDAKLSGAAFAAERVGAVVRG